MERTNYENFISSAEDMNLTKKKLIVLCHRVRRLGCIRDGAGVRQVCWSGLDVR